MEMRRSDGISAGTRIETMGMDEDRLRPSTCGLPLTRQRLGIALVFLILMSVAIAALAETAETPSERELTLTIKPVCGTYKFIPWLDAYLMIEGAMTNVSDHDVKVPKRFNATHLGFDGKRFLFDSFGPLSATDFIMLTPGEQHHFEYVLPTPKKPGAHSVTIKRICSSKYRDRIPDLWTGSLKSNTIVVNVERDREYADRVRRIFSEIDEGGTKGVDSLVSLMKSPNGGMRAKVVEKLGDVDPSPLVVATLIVALRDDSPTVRVEAAQALGDAKDSTAEEPLIDALEDDDPFVKAYAASALGKMKSRKAVKPLIHLLKSEDLYFVRQNASSALADIGDPMAIDALRGVVENVKENKSVSRSARRALDLLKTQCGKGQNGPHSQAVR